MIMMGKFLYGFAHNTYIVRSWELSKLGAFICRSSLELSGLMGTTVSQT